MMDWLKDDGDDDEEQEGEDDDVLLQMLSGLFSKTTSLFPAKAATSPHSTNDIVSLFRSEVTDVMDVLFAKACASLSACSSFSSALKNVVSYKEMLVHN